MYSYDRILYPTHCYPDTHPDALARTATLFGLQSPPIDRCRVLEIGCNDGGNLIPMAFELPRSEFVGIDLAGATIQRAQRTIDATGAGNVKVSAFDLMDIEKSFGIFDYIIAHGFYSWVPGDVQQKLLRVCRENLSPQGVAFVSFNTYPAGHIRQAAREMMLFHADTTSQDDRVRSGKEFLKWLSNSVAQNDLWKMVLREEIDRLGKRSDNAIFHDELSSNFSCSYFSDFAAAAERSGLQFISEVSLGEIFEPTPSPETAAALDRYAAGDTTRYQQYLDFVTFRGFRRTLLCHGEIQLDRPHLADRVRDLIIASPLELTEEKPDGAAVLKNRSGAGNVSTNNRIVIDALRELAGMWPRGIPFSELAKSVAAKAESVSKSEVEAALANTMLKLSAKKLVDLRTYDAQVAVRINERPTTTNLARLHAAEGSLIATLLHREVEIPDADTRRLIQLLDGTRDISALASCIAGHKNRTEMLDMENKVRAMLQDFCQLALLASTELMFKPDPQPL